jgi:2-polyprenyl-3-methyl-5-hydroxy-6-metoxy-1,4-benzoquinol methylase
MSIGRASAESSRTGLHMATDPTTTFYERHAQEYFARTVGADMSALYDRFLPHVRPGGRILDLGCGSGRDLKAFIERGFDASGIDASPALVKLATDYSGVRCAPMRLEELRSEAEFDAVWACASLLHIRKKKLVAVLRRVRRSLVPGGLMFASVRIGDGEATEPDGRYFAYYSLAEFGDLCHKAGFRIEDLWTSDDSLREGPRSILWANVIGCNLR